MLMEAAVSTAYAFAFTAPRQSLPGPMTAQTTCTRCMLQQRRPRQRLAITVHDSHRKSDMFMSMSASEGEHDDEEDRGQSQDASSTRTTETSASTSSPSRSTKRRKRKQIDDKPASNDKENDATIPATTTPASSPSKTAPPQSVVELKPRQDSAVTMQVQDVRDLIANRSSSSSSSSAPTSQSLDTSMSTKSTTTSSSSSSSTSSSMKTRTSTDPSSNNRNSKSLDDSLAQLLADAQQMQRQQQPTDSQGAATPVKAAGSAIRNALSTLVIADFFVVCLFLLWFLAGVVASYVLKNDAIQIAFNGIFQPIVQPALGILMIAAIADRVFAQNENDDASENE